MCALCGVSDEFGTCCVTSLSHVSLVPAEGSKTGADVDLARHNSLVPQDSGSTLPRLTEPETWRLETRRDGAVTVLKKSRVQYDLPVARAERRQRLIVSNSGSVTQIL